MKPRLIACLVMTVLIAVPVMANICDLNCDLDTRPAAPSSCHETEAAGAASNHHSVPSSCSHDHVTPRAAVKSSVTLLNQFGLSHHLATTPSPVASPGLSDPGRASMRDESPPLKPFGPRPLRI